MTPHHTAAPCEEATVEGVPAVVIEDAVREAIAEALADLLLAALEREGLEELPAFSEETHADAVR